MLRCPHRPSTGYCCRCPTVVQLPLCSSISNTAAARDPPNERLIGHRARRLLQSRRAACKLDVLQNILSHTRHHTRSVVGRKLHLIVSSGRPALRLTEGIAPVVRGRHKMVVNRAIPVVKGCHAQSLDGRTLSHVSRDSRKIRKSRSGVTAAERQRCRPRAGTGDKSTPKRCATALTEPSTSAPQKLS